MLAWSDPPKASSVPSSPPSGPRLSHSPTSPSAPSQMCCGPGTVAAGALVLWAEISNSAGTGLLKR